MEQQLAPFTLTPSNLKEVHICKVPDCTRIRSAKGYCAMHYWRLWKTGTIELATRVRGTGCVVESGYLRRGLKRKMKYDHVIVAERVLGRTLPFGACVHHVDEDRLNNAPSNLVLCPSTAYHSLLHQRMEALKTCGHAHWRKCNFCKRYDDPAHLFINKKGVYHRGCLNAYARAKYKEKRP